MAEHQSAQSEDTVRGGRSQHHDLQAHGLGMKGHQVQVDGDADQGDRDRARDELVPRAGHDETTITTRASVVELPTTRSHASNPPHPAPLEGAPAVDTAEYLDTFLWLD